MHSTSNARLALVCLLVALATVVLARMGELRFRTQSRLTPTRPGPTEALPTTHEGDALRDGRAIDPNFASPVELELLPGVGPSLARAIVAQRLRTGPFRSLEALRQVRGIGPKTLAKLAPLLHIDSERLEHAAEAQRHVGGAP